MHRNVKKVRHQVSKIAIIGGHGKIALQLARILTGDGHSVSSFIRSPDHTADVERTGASPVMADVERMDVGAMAAAMAGQDAVVWSAGAGGGDPERTYAVDRDAAIRSMDAAEQAGVPRYVMVSYFGASPQHGVDPDNPFYAYAESKAAADAHLAATSLAWTILGPGKLTDGPATGLIEIGADSGEVTRDDVAGVAATVLRMPESAGKFLQFTGGDTPIDRALADASR